MKAAGDESERQWLMHALELSGEELDALLGADAAKAATVRALVDVLAVKLKPRRLPAVVRTPAPAFGGRTMLRVIRDGEHEQLLASVRASFQWDSS